VAGTGAYSTGTPAGDCTDVARCTVASVLDGNDHQQHRGRRRLRHHGVFPVDTPTAPANARFKNNAHVNQGLTVLMNPAAALPPR